MPTHKFHANPELFADPYHYTDKSHLSSLASCPNPPLQGCNSPASTCKKLIDYSANVFHGTGGKGVRFIQLAKSSNEHFQNGNGGYVTVGDDEFDTMGIIAPSKAGWDFPVISPLGSGFLGTRRYANPTLAQAGGQIQWRPAGKPDVVMKESYEQPYSGR